MKLNNSKNQSKSSNRKANKRELNNLLRPPKPPILLNLTLELERLLKSGSTLTVKNFTAKKLILVMEKLEKSLQDSEVEST